MRPVTTLFMLMSVDGKISTGATDELDFDKNFPHIEGIREGLQQYYDIEQTTDLWPLNSGRVQAKLFDYVDIVVAPVLVGGRETSTLIDGEALTTTKELSKLGVLKLEAVQQLEGSYIRLRYQVIS